MESCLPSEWCLMELLDPILPLCGGGCWSPLIAFLILLALFLRLEPLLWSLLFPVLLLPFPLPPPPLLGVSVETDWDFRFPAGDGRDTVMALGLDVGFASVGAAGLLALLRDPWDLDVLIFPLVGVGGVILMGVASAPTPPTTGTWWSLTFDTVKVLLDVMDARLLLEWDSRRL